MTPGEVAASSEKSLRRDAERDEQLLVSVAEGLPNACIARLRCLIL
jgi:hypothetical protein